MRMVAKLIRSMQAAHSCSTAEQQDTLDDNDGSRAVEKENWRVGWSRHTKLLDKLLVLVQLLQVLHSHSINAKSLGLFTMLVVTQNTHLPGSNNSFTFAKFKSCFDSIQAAAKNRVMKTVLAIPSCQV